MPFCYSGKSVIFLFLQALVQVSLEWLSCFNTSNKQSSFKTFYGQCEDSKQGKQELHCQCFAYGSRGSWPICKRWSPLLPLLVKKKKARFQSFQPETTSWLPIKNVKLRHRITPGCLFNSDRSNPFFRYQEQWAGWLPTAWLKSDMIWGNTGSVWWCPQSQLRLWRKAFQRKEMCC